MPRLQQQPNWPVFSTTSALVSCIMIGLTSAPTNAEMLWRVKEKDAPNALYLFLRLNGYEDSYEVFFSDADVLVDNPTLASIQQCASDRGYDLIASQMDMKGLLGLGRPAILFNTRPGTRIGRWDVLLYANDEHVAVVTGDTIVPKLISIDTFRHSWSGHVLTSRSTASFGKWLRYVSVVSLLVALTTSTLAVRNYLSNTKTGVENANAAIS